MSLHLAFKSLPIEFKFLNIEMRILNWNFTWTFVLYKGMSPLNFTPFTYPGFHVSRIWTMVGLGQAEATNNLTSEIEKNLNSFSIKRCFYWLKKYYTIERNCSFKIGETVCVPGKSGQVLVPLLLTAKVPDRVHHQGALYWHGGSRRVCILKQLRSSTSPGSININNNYIGNIT